MSIETSKLELIPTAGINSTDNLSRLKQGEVSDSSNLLYEQNQAMTRCGLVTFDYGGIVANSVNYVDSIDIDGVLYLVTLDSIGTLYFTFGGVTTVITGAGTTFDNVSFQNATSIIGLVVFGNNVGGIVIWDPAGTTYTVAPQGPYRYVVGHKGRAVAAYRLAGGTTATNPRIFAWSMPGDVAIWTSTDGSAGEEAIADINDDITGLGVLHDIVVILRRYGVHLAFPTGDLPLVYDVQTFTLKGAGCFWPSTAAFSDEIAYFVGEDDVYSFDMQSITSIGYNIRNQLCLLLRAGIFYRGFVSRANTQDSQRLRYNLFPVGPNASPGLPHFIYDIKDGTWSVQHYNTAANWAFYYATNFSPSFGFGPAFVDQSNSPSISYWSDQVHPEKASSLTRYMGRVDSPEKDYQVEDLLIRYQDVSVTPVPVTVTIVGTGSAGNVTTTATVSVGGANDSKWKRVWMSRSSTNLRQSGNEFVVTVSIASGYKFIFDYVGLMLTDQGDFRG